MACGIHTQTHKHTNTHVLVAHTVILNGAVVRSDMMEFGRPQVTQPLPAVCWLAVARMGGQVVAAGRLMQLE